MSDIDWDHRDLCPDGACNGVIGSDGLCKVCGRTAPNWGDERMRGLQNEPDEQDEDEDEDELEDGGDDGGDQDDDEDADDEDDEDDEDDDADETGEGEGEWTERKLCDDGACVGVIGDDGKCTVCGKRSAA